MRRGSSTAVRTGVISIATEQHAMSRSQRDVFEARDRRPHAAIGVPIAIHLEGGTFGLEQLELLGSLGVQPAAVSLAHVEKNADAGYHRELAATGAYLVFTSPGRIKTGRTPC